MFNWPLVYVDEQNMTKVQQDQIIFVCDVRKEVNYIDPCTQTLVYTVWFTHNTDSSVERCSSSVAHLHLKETLYLLLYILLQLTYFLM